MGSTMTVFLLLQFAFTTQLYVRLGSGASHQPLPVAHVRLARLGFTIQDVVTLDGKVEFAGLVPGRYTIAVDAPGYQTSYTELDLPADSFALIDLRPKDWSRPTRPQSSASGQSIRHIFHKLFR